MSIYQLVTKAVSADGNQLRNVHHYEFESYVPTSSQLQDLVDNFDSESKTYLQQHISDNITIYAYDVRRVDSANLPSDERVPTNGSWAGTPNDDQHPLQLAALTTFKAPTVFPRSSRTYHFPFTEASNDGNGRLSTTVQANLDDWGEDVLNITITGDSQARKVAVKYGGTPRVVTDSNQLETVISSRNFATQRRRKRGVGI